MLKYLTQTFISGYRWMSVGSSKKYLNKYLKSILLKTYAVGIIWHSCVLTQICILQNFKYC